MIARPRLPRVCALLALLAIALPPTVASADTPSPGDIPDNQAFVRISTAGYSLQAPEGWARTTSGRRITLTDKYNAIQVELSALPAARRCAPRRRMRSRTSARRSRGSARPA